MHFLLLRLISNTKTKVLRKTGVAVVEIIRTEHPESKSSLNNKIYKHVMDAADIISKVNVHFVLLNVIILESKVI